jgi:Tol biopolymer transport system component
VAWVKEASGRSEVVVTTFPDAKKTSQLTNDGALSVVSWSQDGREILVATMSGQIVAYPVSTAGGSFSAGQPKIRVPNLAYAATYASATPDHSKVLIRVVPNAAKDKGEIRLLFGWQDALRKR